MSRKKKLTITIGVLALLIVCMLAAGWAVFIKSKPIQSSTRKSFSVHVDDSITSKDAYYDSIASELQSRGFDAVRSNSAEADVVVSPNKMQGFEKLTTQSQGSPNSLKDGNIVNPSEVYVSFIKLPSEVEDGLLKIKSSIDQKISKPKSWTLNIAGDIIIGRSVYEQEMKRNDYTSSFLKVKDLLQNADYTIADAEWTAADGIPHPLDGMSFSSPAKSLDGLTYAGIDAVSLANNHSMNGGVSAFEQMLDNLTTRGIGYFGAGRNYTEAHNPYVADIKGTKVAFLGYTSIPGNVESGPNNTGNAFIKIAPWYPFDEAGVVQMENDIRNAKTKADVVIPYFHWSQEYTHQPNEQMRNVAHRAIDAGAAMVVGSHPHWVQGIEWYKDSLIAYSLGNFIFDQEQSLKTKQGAILSTVFSGNKLTKADLIPIQIEQYYQPHLLDSTNAQSVLNDIFSNSFWKN